MGAVSSLSSGVEVGPKKRISLLVNRGAMAEEESVADATPVR
jgi:hypothetical protein